MSPHSLCFHVEIMLAKHAKKNVFDATQSFAFAKFFIELKNGQKSVSYVVPDRMDFDLRFFEFQPPKSVVSAGFADESRERPYIVTGPDIETRIG